MVLELGPCQADEAAGWVRFARRILLELRAAPESEQPVSSDLIDLWARTLDDWSRSASEAGHRSEPFRWSSEYDPEVAEFQLHGLERCLRSPVVMAWITPQEAHRQQPFTMRVVRAFVDGLNTEGTSCRHYAEEVSASFGRYLAD